MDNDLNTTDAPTQRILIIAETVARYGPITLAQLTERLQFSRGAIWRAINMMRAQGWVRMRLGDNAYELRSGFVSLFSASHHALPEIETLEPFLSQAANLGAVYVDLCHFSGLGRCQIVESNRKSMPRAPLSLCDDDLAVAAQLRMTPKDLVAHLRAYIETASDEERRIITSGEHGRYLARLRESGVVWMDDRTAVAFPLPNFTGFALRAELWRTTKSELAGFTDQMTQLIAQAQHLSPQGVAPQTPAADSPEPRVIRILPPKTGEKTQ